MGKKARWLNAVGRVALVGAWPSLLDVSTPPQRAFPGEEEAAEKPAEVSRLCWALAAASPRRRLQASPPRGSVCEAALSSPLPSPPRLAPLRALEVPKLQSWAGPGGKRPPPPLSPPSPKKTRIICLATSQDWRAEFRWFSG